MKTIKYTFLLLLFFFVGCTILHSTYSDCDQEVKFSNYKTFAWLPDSDTSKKLYPDKIVLNITRNYFNYCMAERGYKGDSEEPDILLDLVVSESKKQKIANLKSCNKNSCDYFYLNPYYYPFPNPYYFNKPNSYSYDEDYTIVSHKREYAEGALTLNIIDRKQNRLVWTGTAWGDLYAINYNKNNLHPMAYSILEKFPMQPLKKELTRKK